mmetsp:Transcript_33957/g.54637  ORF Transcript_33957/g.54637 Transcript_33957/m.54637 type:complete len:581 (+) Transcript_33957:155-1897(+)
MRGGEGGVGPAPGPPEAFGEKMRVCVKAGSCILIHFDIWHRGTRNISKDKLRYMFKMQAVRMNEPLPDNPSWNSNSSSLSKLCVIKQQHQLQQPQQQQKASLPRIPKMDPVWEAMWSYLNQKQSQSSGSMDDDDAETIAGAAKMGGENEQDCKANRGPYDDALDHRHFCQLKRDLYESLYVDRHPCRGTHECVGVVAKGSPKSHTTAHHLEGIVSKEIRAMNAAYILATSYGNRGASTLMSAALSPDQAHCRAAAAASRRSAVALASLHSQQDTVLELGLITRLAKAICGEGQSLGISRRAKDHHNEHQEASSAPPSSSSPCVQTTSVAGARETACFIAGEWASIYASLLRSSSSSLSARKSTNDDHQGKEKPTEGEQDEKNRRRLVDDIIGALASALSKRDECSLVRIAAAEALGSIGNMLAISFCRSSCRSHKEEQKEHKECALPDNNDSYSSDLAAKLIIRRIERCLGDVIRTEMVNESPPPPLPPSSSSSSSSSSSAGGGTMCPQLLQFAVGSLARLGKQASGSVELLAAVAATSSDRYARNTALEALKRLGETERLASQLMWERFCPLTAVDNAY